MAQNIWLVMLLIISIAAIISGTSKLKLHPFLVLLVVSYFVALGSGMRVNEIARVISTGFGNLMTGIGLVIVLGTLIGVVLEKSGAAVKLAEIILKVVGPRFPILAMSLIGYIVSIPVFCDSAFVILTSVRKSIALKTGKSPVALSIALATGLYATHTLVPPTPGPIAAAGNLGLNNQLGLVILMGLLMAMFATISGYFYAIKFKNQNPEIIKIEKDETELDKNLKIPAGWKALLPVVLPIILIGARSVAMLPSYSLGNGTVYRLLDFAGHPVNALALGFASTLLLFPKFNKQTLTGWVSDGLIAAAPILLITGAGGSFGEILKETQIAGILGKFLAQYNLGIFLPFLVAAIFKTAQGSSTVAMVASSALIAPMLPALGLETETGVVLALMATGAGAMTVSHANDSYFWVVTQFSGIPANTGYKTHTLATFIQGISTIVAVWIISYLII